MPDKQDKKTQKSKKHTFPCCFPYVYRIPFNSILRLVLSSSSVSKRSSSRISVSSWSALENRKLGIPRDGEELDGEFVLFCRSQVCIEIISLKVIDQTSRLRYNCHMIIFQRHYTFLTLCSKIQFYNLLYVEIERQRLLCYQQMYLVVELFKLQRNA